MLQDLEEVEEWNEYGELKENIGDLPPASSAPPPGVDAAGPQPHQPSQPSQPIQPETKTKSDGTAGVQSGLNNLSMKEAAAQAASIGAARKGPTPGINDTKVRPVGGLAEADAATKPETMNSSAAAKTESIRAAEDTSTLASNASDNSNAPQPAALSAVESNDDLSTAATPAGSVQQKHRGSSVSNANADEIKEVEESTVIPEAENEDEEQPKTQAQETAAADKASVSVED